MPLSVQGNAVLTKMWDDFRTFYCENNPGCNMNDVERYFLHHILQSLYHHSDAFEVYLDKLNEVESMIEKIQ